MWPCSHCISGRSSATPRSNVIGLWVWALTRPGISAASGRETVSTASKRARASLIGRIATMMPSRTATACSSSTSPCGTTGTTWPASIRTSQDSRCMRLPDPETKRVGQAEGAGAEQQPGQDHQPQRLAEREHSDLGREDARQGRVPEPQHRATGKEDAEEPDDEVRESGFHYGSVAPALRSSFVRTVCSSFPRRRVPLYFGVARHPG